LIKPLSTHPRSGNLGLQLDFDWCHSLGTPIDNRQRQHPPAGLGQSPPTVQTKTDAELATLIAPRAVSFPNGIGRD